MELVSQHQAAYGHNQEKMVEIEEEEHLILKLETPFEHKASVAEVEGMMESRVLDFQVVELMVAPREEAV